LSSVLSFSLVGYIQKLKCTLESPVQYRLLLDEQEIHLNAYLGKKISLQFMGEIRCVYCSRMIKKNYNQGYCFPCSQKLARADFCIVKPELCHHHLGTCREPDWGVAHCMIPHIVYLANTSGLKVGITRENQIPIRWMDQGATQALPILRAKSRLHSGLVESQLAKSLQDKTDWRKMLRGSAEPLDLINIRDTLFLTESAWNKEGLEKLMDEKPIFLNYPVLNYPNKVNAIRFEKQPTLTGTLLGIKGQYLLLDTGVVNIRNHSGFKLGVILS